MFDGRPQTCYTIIEVNKVSFSHPIIKIAPWPHDALPSFGLVVLCHRGFFVESERPCRIICHHILH